MQTLTTTTTTKPSHNPPSSLTTPCVSLLMDQNPHHPTATTATTNHCNNKYFCRICKKGFVSGQALGGHMRAHDVNDELSPEEDGLHPLDFGEEEEEGSRRMYSLRSNPDRNNKYLAEEEEEEVEGSSMVDFHQRLGEVETKTGACPTWSKGKRTRRSVVVDGPSSEEEDLAANCLVMLSTARVENVVVTETEESCASASKEEEEVKHQQVGASTSSAVISNLKFPSFSPRGVFECKACKRVFNSHQALGGHRASHKKVKGCFASKLESFGHRPEEEDPERPPLAPFDPTTVLALSPSRKKGKLHECTICHRVFTSGQALGGHKRCHWLTSNATAGSKLHQNHDNHSLIQPQPSLTLDLNLPASTVAASDHLGRKDFGDKLVLEAPTALSLQTFVHPNNTNYANGTSGCSRDVTEDERENKKVKLAKLSDIKDVGMGVESPQWLQMGLGPCVNGTTSEP